MKIATPLAIGILTIVVLEARAANVSTTALFDEASLSISGSNGSSVISSTETSFFTDTFTPFKEETLFGSTDASFSNLLDNYGNGSTFASGEFSPDQASITNIDATGLGSAVTLREWDITVSGAGTVSVDIEYLLKGDIFDGDDRDAESYGAVEIFFEGTEVNEAADFFLRDTDSVGDEEFLSFFDTLSITKPVIDGESVTLVMLASTSANSSVAAVPLPAALPLFLSAVVGFGLIHPRRRKKA